MHEGATCSPTIDSAGLHGALAIYLAIWPTRAHLRISGAR